MLGHSHLVRILCHLKMVQTSLQTLPPPRKYILSQQVALGSFALRCEDLASLEDLHGVVRDLHGVVRDSCE